MSDQISPGLRECLPELDKASAPFRDRNATLGSIAEDPRLQDVLGVFPSLFPKWVSPLGEYNHCRYGPLLGVSDEGSAGNAIAEAALQSAKVEASGSDDPNLVGVAIDGERMTSAGEVPIGPEEYREIVYSAFAKTHCTTSVGVRINTRIYQPLPEFDLTAETTGVGDLAEQIVARFGPFVSPDPSKDRPLTVRLKVTPGAQVPFLGELIARIDSARAGRNGIGSSSTHRLSLLIIFEKLVEDKEVEDIKKAIEVAAGLGISEVAVDGIFLDDARRRLTVAGLLNLISPQRLDEILKIAAAAGIELTYRFSIDTDSAARTIWTGLHTAQAHGLSAAKFGLVPLSLQEQLRVIPTVMEWMKGWTAIPAFYVDTPMVGVSDSYGEQRVVEVAKIWIEKVAEIGVKMILIDSPDRIVPRRLLKAAVTTPDDRGVLTFEDARELNCFARDRAVKILWSGGITPEQAYNLAKLEVAGIFTTSSTAERIAVGRVLRNDPQLPFENEPTVHGVRRIHALIQAGFLVGALGSGELVSGIEKAAQELLIAIGAKDNEKVDAGVVALNELLVRGWKEHWKSFDE